MPRQEFVLTVFVASPSDVEDERVKLEEIIRELNITWSRELCIRLDLVRWETHAFPGVGDDAQDVINQQIPDDYDLFVGIMWHRYGTPTKRVGSGTVEEFMRAKARYDADPTSIKIMVYFKDEPVPPSQLEPSQLSKVNEFRTSLGDEGVLYWKFNDIKQFEQLFRLHLTRQVQSWNSRSEEMKTSSVQVEPPEPVIDESQVELEDDFGVLDLVDFAEDRFGELTNIAVRISAATDELGEKITARARDLETLPHDTQGNISRKEAKRLISRAATDMNQYTTRVEAELPLFSQALNAGMDAFVRTASMYERFGSDETATEELNEALLAIIALRSTFSSSQQSFTEFRGTAAGLPPMTKELNRAKRDVVSVLDKLITIFNSGQTLLREAEVAVRHLLSKEDM